MIGDDSFNAKSSIKVQWSSVNDLEIKSGGISVTSEIDENSTLLKLDSAPKEQFEVVLSNDGLGPVFTQITSW